MQYGACADDIVLTTETEDVLKNTTNVFQKEEKDISQNINETQTKYTTLFRQKYSANGLKIEDYIF